MAGKKSVSFEEYKLIMDACLGILAKNGFTGISGAESAEFAKSEFYQRAIPIANEAFDFLDVEIKGAKIKSWPKTKADLTINQLNQMVMECALVFLDHGIRDVHYNESLNSIRIMVEGLLEDMGYSVTTMHDHTPWLGYKLWEEIARKDGLSEKKIQEDRQATKKDFPRQYQP